jgi:hypothetical protein
LYSDPLGTPGLVLTVTPDPDQTSSSTATTVSSVALFACTPTTLTAGVTYGVALRPTTTNNFTIGYYDLLTGNSKIKNMALFGASLSFAGRADVTGAFSVVQTYYLPSFYLRISKLDDGVSAAGFAGFWVS